GLSKPVRDLTSVVNRYGVAQYTIVENAQTRCTVFAQYFWLAGRLTSNSPGDAQLIGNICLATSHPRAGELPGLTTTLLQNIQFGKGVNASSAATASATAAATSAP